MCPNCGKSEETVEKRQGTTPSHRPFRPSSGFISYTYRYSDPENLDQSRPKGYLLLNALLPLRIIGLIGPSLSNFHLAVAHPSTFPFYSSLTCHQEQAELWWASRSPAPLQEYSVERIDWYSLELFSSNSERRGRRNRGRRDWYMIPHMTSHYEKDTCRYLYPDYFQILAKPELRILGGAARTF